MTKKSIPLTAAFATLLLIATSAIAAIPANGTYYLVNRATGMYLDSYGSTANGSGARQYTYTSWPAQLWTLSSGSGYYQLNVPSVVGDMYLDSGGDTGNGSACLIWQLSGSANQKWNIIDLGTGYYKIQNQGNGR